MHTALTRLLVPLLLVFSGCDPFGSYSPPPTGGGGGYRPSYLGQLGGGGGFAAGGGTGGGSFCVTSTEGTVIEHGPTPAAITGGTMVALRGGGFVIADPDRTLVWLVSADFTQIRSIPLQPGDEPGRVIEGADGTAYVSLRRAGQVAEVDVASGTLRRLTTCDLPRGIAWRKADSQLIVACLGGELESIDPVTTVRTSVVTSRPLSDLRDVVIDGDRLLLTRWRSAEVLSVDSTGAVSALTTALVPDATPHVAWRAIARPSGGALVVRQQHRTSVLPAPAPCVGYYGGDSGFVARDVVESELVSVSGVSSTRVPLSGAIGSASGLAAVVLPVDVAISPSGRVAVVSAGTGTVSLLELGQRRDVPVTSHGNDTQLTSVVFVNESAIVFSREPANLLEVRPDGTVVLRASLGGVSSASTGHELFHRATSTNIACASCHPEAGEDGHVWPFFEGPRRTPTLRGGIASTAPFHWAGDMASMDVLMGSVMTQRMRGPTLTSESVRSVEDWLNLQPRLPAPRVDEDAKTRGGAVFAAAGCSACHSGAQGTNNRTVDVGTGSAFQVPRLVEFGWRAPWFHDGRMFTPQDRFAASAGGQLHGDTQSLTAEQRADLLVYLQSR